MIRKQDNWLFYAEQEEIERVAFWRVAKIIVIAFAFGLLLVPFVLPWGGQ